MAVAVVGDTVLDDSVSKEVVVEDEDEAYAGVSPRPEW